MRNIGFSTMALLLIASMALPAQKPGGRGGRGARMPDSTQIAHMANRLHNALNLTDGQKKQVNTLHFDHFARMKEERDAAMATGDMEGMRDIFRESREKLNNTIKALLDNDQKKAFEEHLKEREARRREFRDQRDRNN